MARCRVLVLYGQSLLSKGLLRWLSEQDGVEACGVDMIEPDVSDRISRFSPAAIIVDETDVATNGHLAVSELVRDYPETAVVRVAPATNAVSIFRQQRVVIADVEDLLHLVVTAQEQGLQARREGGEEKRRR